MGERSGRGAGRVGSDFLSAIAGRVGSGQRFAGSGRVQEKWPVDNSDQHTGAIRNFHIIIYWSVITRIFCKNFDEKTLNVLSQAFLYSIDLVIDCFSKLVFASNNYISYT